MTDAPTVVLYELNEVPWQIVDLFVARRPDSAFARLMRTAATWTTVDDDPADLSPWRTWPTLHRSMYTADHNSFELGQDPATFRGVEIWDVLDAVGVPVGLFGAMQSWPAREFGSGGFYVPDTFARDAGTYPAGLSTFQDFTLRMTAENVFSADAPLSVGRLAGVGVDLVRRGLTPESAFRLVRHLARERRDRRYRAARPMMQVLPSFDVFWKLFRTRRPQLAVFFTNHVASMMHRFWGDAVPGYETEFSYRADEVYAGFVPAAMELVDRQLAKVMAFVDAHADARLVVAASMGQGPVPHGTKSTTRVVLADGARLGRFLDCGEARPRLAMHPKGALEFDDPDSAGLAATRLARVAVRRGQALFASVGARGTTVTFTLADGAVGPTDDRSVVLDDRVAGFDAVGLEVRERLGGNNTAYHVPEGVLLDYAVGDRRPQGGRRAEVSVLDVAPSLLHNVFGVAPPDTMRGRCRDDLFA